MAAEPQDLLEQVVAAVQKGERYRLIHPGLVRNLAQAELLKGRKFKEAVKATRNRLHQVGGAYLEKPLPVDHWLAELPDLPDAPDAPELEQFCRACMQSHASTRERLPILEEFYTTLFQSLAPVHSLLDLACGLNPLALRWMPLAKDAVYYACDIYRDQLELVGEFFHHLHQAGETFLCDLTCELPVQEVQVALLLKTIPCLEQVDKSVGRRLLEQIRAEHLVVSFPVHSLGGRSKGMLRNYEAHFEEMTAGQNWHIRRFLFPSELVFLISR